MTRAPMGRDREREHLLSRLAMARAGEGSVVLVEGEGGTGKSTLVATLLDAARAAGLHVLHGRSWELSSSVPYESLVAAVSRHLRSRASDDVTRLTNGLPTLGALIEWLDLQPPATAPEAFKVRAQDAFATLVARIGADQPVVLALDDLHWADQASLEVLQYLSLDLPDTPLLLVVTTRPDEADRRPELRQLLSTLRRSPYTSTLRLGRLERSAIDAVVADHLGGNVTPRVYDTIASRSGGTPLLIHELLDDLVERGVIVRRGPVWQVLDDDVPVTRSATDLIRSRLDRVEAHDRAVLEALAVVNGPTDPHVVAALLGIEVDAVDGSLERLRRIRLAVETDRGMPHQPGSGWMVEHPIVAEVVEAELVDGARRRLHRRLLDVDVEAPLGRRARHALIAGEPNDRAATIDLLIAAGTEALARATPAAAIEPLRGALSLLTDGDDDALRHRIERDLGTACLRQLEVDRALVHLRSAWDRAERNGDVAACIELLHPLDNAEFRAGNGGVSTSALERLRMAIADREAWDLLVDLSWVHLSHAGRGQSIAELRNAEAALALIPPEAAPARYDALRELVADYADRGSLSDSAGARVEHFLESANRWSQFPDVIHRSVLLAFDAAMLSGDPGLIERCQALHHRIEQQTGEPPTWRAPMVAGFRSIAEGRLDERPADLRLYGAMPRSAGLGTMMRALATRFTDGPEAATAVLDDDADAGPAGSADRTARLYEVYARLLVAIGTPAETRAAAAVNAEVAGDTLLAPVSGFAFGGATTLARGLTGDPTALAELDTAGAGRWLPSAWACVLRARHAASSADAAAELLLSADILDGLGRRLEAAERVIDAAEAHLDGCGTDRLEAALGIAREAGARWLIARAEALLPSGPAQRVVRDGDGPLTSREMDVVELVAEGLTNREIAGRLYISIRTVTSHLDHIYTKLGLSSRDALTDWRRRLEHARS